MLTFISVGNIVRAVLDKLNPRESAASQPVRQIQFNLNNRCPLHAAFHSCPDK